MRLKIKGDQFTRKLYKFGHSDATYVNKMLEPHGAKLIPFPVFENAIQ